MSVLDNVSGAAAGVVKQPGGMLPASDDALIAMFLDETEPKEKGSDIIDTGVYPDFEAPAPPEYEPGPWPSDGGLTDGTMPGADDLGTDGEKVLLSLATLPVETIVDTVDITLTELIVRGCKLEDYEGKDDDKLMTTEADRAALVKATERYLESQSIRVTPLTGLLVTVALVYGKKMMYGMKLKKLVAKADAMARELDALREANARMTAELRAREAEAVDDDEITDAVWHEVK
ncbi:MAG: hypothetical protein K2H70_02725 [Bacteroidales bacterium]|nr:hypothetical protein [Bacteroidales bacterium]